MQSRSIQGFHRPFAIHQDRIGNFLVADFILEPGVAIFDADFSPRGWITENGLSPHRPKPEDSLFVGPHSIDFDSRGQIYICDYRAERVLKFSSDFRLLEVVIDHKTQKLDWLCSGPATCRIDANDDLLISDYGSHSLQKFSANGTFIEWLGRSQDGDFSDVWRTTGTPAVSHEIGGFDRLHAVDFDREKNLLIVDTWNHRIQKFSQKGMFLGWLGMPIDSTINPGWLKIGEAIESEKAGGFSKPVAISRDDDYFVTAEYGTSRIQKFSLDGKCLESNFGSFLHPYDVKSISGVLYVADSDHQRIAVIEP